MSVATGVTFTDKGVEKIKALLKSEGKDPAEFGLRVGVKGGGCSGFMYVLDLDLPKEKDMTFEDRGVRIIVDGKSIMFLRGSQIDYQETMMGSGFKIVNPMEKGRCGCGESFTV